MLGLVDGLPYVASALETSWVDSPKAVTAWAAHSQTFTLENANTC